MGKRGGCGHPQFFFFKLIKYIFLLFLINYMDTCRTMIGSNVVFHQILDEILTERPFSSLSKSDGPPLIKSKPKWSKNKEVKPGVNKIFNPIIFYPHA